MVYFFYQLDAAIIADEKSGFRKKVLPEHTGVTKCKEIKNILKITHALLSKSEISFN